MIHFSRIAVACSVLLLALSGTGRALGAIIATNFGNAGDRLHASREVAGNSSLGSGAGVEQLPPIPTFEFAFPFPLSGGGLSVGPDVSRTTFPLGGDSTCDIFSIGLLGQQDFGPNSSIIFSASQEFLRAPGFSGTGLKVVFGGGFGDRIRASLLEEFHFPSGGTEVVEITTFSFSIHPNIFSGNTAGGGGRH